MQNFQISIQRLLTNVAMALRFGAKTLAYRAMVHLPPHEMRRLSNELAARRRPSSSTVDASITVTHAG